MKKLFAKIVITALLITQLSTPVLACTEPLTQGYWKNHVCEWCHELQDENLCGYTWQEVLNTPTRGDAWYILAHQYIAFRLNICNGAFDRCSYKAELAQTEELLEYGPGNIPANLRASAIELAEMLDELNNK
ncbi:MAG: hypothetical protein WCQ54_07140 [Clostridiaceae bacterium]